MICIGKKGDGFMTPREYIRVLPGEARIIESSAATPVLATFDLGADIAVTCYNPATRRVGIARTDDAVKMESFLRDMTQSNFIDPLPVCDVRVVGGHAQSGHRDFLLGLARLLHAIDGGRDIVNLASSDIGDVPHPDSFKIVALDGKLQEATPFMD
jgi:hypothetical protein